MSNKNVSKDISVLLAFVYKVIYFYIFVYQEYFYLFIKKKKIYVY